MFVLLDNTRLWVKTGRTIDWRHPIHYTISNTQPQRHKWSIICGRLPAHTQDIHMLHQSHAASSWFDATKTEHGQSHSCTITLGRLINYKRYFFISPKGKKYQRPKLTLFFYISRYITILQILKWIQQWWSTWKSLKIY